jgi:ABC-type antimicrobial peptide transport system permease subunit
MVDWETYPQQAVTWLSTLLGAIALLLTVTGIHGVMAYLVGQRTKEIGIRIALGATPARIASLLFSYSARLAGCGLAAGAVLALGVLQWSDSKIGLMIDYFDPRAYLSSMAVIGLAVLAAALGPVGKGCRVDPQHTLRSD